MALALNVIDTMSAPLYASPDSKEPPISMIPSKTLLLSTYRTSDYYQVNSTAGTGYVHATFIQPFSFPTIYRINPELPEDAQIRTFHVPGHDGTVLDILSPGDIITVTAIVEGRPGQWYKIASADYSEGLYIQQTVGTHLIAIPEIPIFFHRAASIGIPFTLCPYEGCSASSFPLLLGLVASAEAANRLHLVMTPFDESVVSSQRSFEEVVTAQGHIEFKPRVVKVVESLVVSRVDDAGEEVYTAGEASELVVYRVVKASRVWREASQRSAPGPELAVGMMILGSSVVVSDHVFVCVAGLVGWVDIQAITRS